MSIFISELYGKSSALQILLAFFLASCVIMFMRSTSFFGYVFVVNNIIPYFEVTSLFIGSYHFNTYKNKLFLIFFDKKTQSVSHEWTELIFYITAHSAIRFTHSPSHAPMNFSLNAGILSARKSLSCIALIISSLFITILPGTKLL